MKGVSIVLNLYQPDKNVLKRVFDAFQMQSINIPVELVIVDKKTDDIDMKIINNFTKRARNMKTRTIKVDSKLSFAESMNAGLKNSKYENVVVIQQDCIPTSSNWLGSLIEPLYQSNVVATTSKVIYPDELWNSMSLFTKSIMLNEKGTITPGLDEKACGYKKEILGKVGFFNEKEFKTAGEDYDLYIKLKKIGKIAYPDASVYHYHPMDFKSRIKKIRQYSNGFGALFRKTGLELPRWYSGIIKSTPIVGIFGFILAFPYKKGAELFPIYLLLVPILHGNYMMGFWEGFLKGRQEIDIFRKQ
ncbi:MAG: glycosyltransferase [Nanoarchaeota archaeon]